MNFFMIAPYYLYWHYTRGISELSKNLFNFIVFELHFFSVKDLLLTLFSPFQRLKESYGNSIIDFEGIASTFVVNIVMRCVGFCVRSVILFFAFVTLSITSFLIPVLLLLWLVLPFLLLGLMLGSFYAYLTHKP